MKQTKGKIRPNCRVCRDRDACVKPCDALEKELREKYPLNTNVNAMPRLPIPPGEIRDEMNVLKIINDLSSDRAIGPTQREKIILTLDVAGFDRAVVAKIFGINRKLIRKIVYSAKKKLIDS